jgi:NADPH:quinone reductase-like Zn-dependent oxidoreductase
MGAYSRGDRAVLQEVHEDVMSLLSTGAIRALISREVGLRDVAAALGQLRDREVIGRVVVRPD